MSVVLIQKLELQSVFVTMSVEKPGGVVFIVEVTSKVSKTDEPNDVEKSVTSELTGIGETSSGLPVVGEAVNDVTGIGESVKGVLVGEDVKKGSEAREKVNPGPAVEESGLVCGINEDVAAGSETEELGGVCKETESCPAEDKNDSIVDSEGGTSKREEELGKGETVIVSVAVFPTLEIKLDCEKSVDPSPVLPGLDMKPDTVVEMLENTTTVEDDDEGTVLDIDVEMLALKTPIPDVAADTTSDDPVETESGGICIDDTSLLGLAKTTLEVAVEPSTGAPAGLKGGNRVVEVVPLLEID